MILGQPWWTYLILALAIIVNVLLRVRRGTVRGGLSVTLYVFSTVMFFAIFWAWGLVSRFGFLGMFLFVMTSMFASVVLDVLSERVKKR